MLEHRREIFTISLFLLLNLISACGSSGSIPTTPTAVNIVRVQANPNTGNPQPLSFEELFDRTNLRSWRDANWSGLGVKVGVLDREFGGLDQFERISGADVITKSSDYETATGKHGTQVLEVINSVAPNAQLYACQYETFDDYVSCIDWMIISGVKIINHSAGVPVLPLNGQGKWALQVDRAAEGGILWVNAAGNFAQGYFTDNFTDTNLNKFHEFRGSDGIDEVLDVSPIRTGTGLVMLSWLGNKGRSPHQVDLDLQVIDTTNGNVIGQSTRLQDGQPGHEALEIASVDMSREFGIQIVDNNGDAAGVQFALFIEFSTILGITSPQGSIVSPGDSRSSITVGALQGLNIAPYSSRGPLSTGAIKPDLAVSGEIHLRDGTDFVGTSAAAPFIAGIAALVWEANPTWTREEIANNLITMTQDDTDVPGADVVYGRGRLYMPFPEQTTVALVATATRTLEPTATYTETAFPTDTPTVTATYTTTTSPTQAVLPSETHTITPTVVTSTFMLQVLPSSTATPAGESNSRGATVTVKNASVNLRTGPGTNYSIAGAAIEGDQFPVIARANDWYLIERKNGDGVWIWNGTVELNLDNSEIVIAATVPSLPSTPISTISSASTSSVIPYNLERIYYQIPGEFNPTVTTLIPGSVIAPSPYYLLGKAQVIHVEVRILPEYVSHWSFCSVTGKLVVEVNGNTNTYDYSSGSGSDAFWGFKFDIKPPLSGTGKIVSFSLCLKEDGIHRYFSIPMNIGNLTFEE